MWKAIAAVGILVLVCAVGGCGGSDAPGSLVVTTLDDAGPGSLREAIAAVRSGGTIDFAPGLTGMIPLSGIGLVFEKSVTIVGPGATLLEISGQDTLRVMLVAAGVTLRLRDLAVTDGFTGGSGAGIQNHGRLELERVIIAGCTAGRGGGLANEGGAVTCQDVWIFDCEAFNGGGFSNDGGGTLSMTACTVSGCRTTGNSGGGGTNTSTLHLLNTTFSGNFTTGADRVGGALVMFADDEDDHDVLTTAFHCTLTSNSATGFGGGIALRDSLPRTATLQIQSSIVAGNGSGGGGPDIDSQGTVLSGGFNVIGIDTNSDMVDGANGDQVGTAGTPLDPDLGPLTGNGGFTPTHAPTISSPALDVVPLSHCTDRFGNPLTVDQTGAGRPTNLCEAGSVEND